MTGFVRGEDLDLMQRDLGSDTAQTVASIKQFNPDSAWTPLAPEG